MNSPHGTPKERVHIVYRNETGDVPTDVELPLKLLMIGAFRGDADAVPFSERRTIPVGRSGPESALAHLKPTLNLAVAPPGPDDPPMAVSLCFESMRDFEPENLMESIPALREVKRMRDALMAVRAAVASRPQFRRAVRDHLALEPALTADNKDHP